MGGFFQVSPLCAWSVNAKWICKGSPTHEVLKAVVLDPKIINDLKYLTHFMHSGELEVFHSLSTTFTVQREFRFRMKYVRTYTARSHGS